MVPRLSFFRAAALPLLVAACETTSSASTAASDTSAAATDTAAGTASPATDPDALACVDDDFKVVKALSGDGFDPETGLLGQPQERYIVHTTQLVVPPDGMKGFAADMGPIFTQLSKTEGLVALSLAGSEKCGYQRTLGVWRDEASLYAFVASPAHAKAMSNTTEYSTAGRVMHWEATADEVRALTWDVALGKIAQQTNSPVFDDDATLQ